MNQSLLPNKGKNALKEVQVDNTRLPTHLRRGPWNGGTRGPLAFLKKSRFFKGPMIRCHRDIMVMGRHTQCRDSVPAYRQYRDSVPAYR